MSTIKLEVSIAEAVDKLSILFIKCKKIKDEAKLKYCREEYNLLYTDLKEYVEKYPWHYNVLTWINESIWDIQDQVRIDDSQKMERLKLYAARIQDENDMRFRIKNKINNLVNSQIKEVKGYEKQTAVFLGHLGFGDLINHIGAIRYYSFMYDSVTVIVKEQYLENAKKLFFDDPSIDFITQPLNKNEQLINESTGEINNSFLKYLKVNFTKLIFSGIYLRPRSTNAWDDTSDCFYKDMNLSLDIRHVFHYVPYEIVEDTELFSQDYIFVHQVSSTNEINIIKWDINKTLTIDPNQNLYSTEHKWYDIAQRYVNKPFVYYFSAIKNASEVHVVDSSFSCFAHYIPLARATVARCYRRQNGKVISHFTFTNKNNEICSFV
jgi:hypothetical protein